MITVFCSEEYVYPPYGANGGWDPAPPWPLTIPWPEPAHLHTDIDDYLVDPGDYKIAFYLIEYSEGWPEKPKNNILRLAEKSRLVFAIEHEIGPSCLAQDDALNQLANVHWVMPGWSHGAQDRSIPWHYHLWRIRELYRKHLGHYLLPLDPYHPKEFYFDAMLGTRKPHRVQVYHDINRHNLQDKILCSIGLSEGDHLEKSVFEDPGFFLDPEWIPCPGSTYLTLNQSVIVGRKIYVTMSNLLPISLYNRTAYSIVCETWHDNSTLMMTEKLAKALIGRRLFVIFSGAGYLRHLRSQGFQTFGNVIDERYDDEPDNQKRWAMAFEQVQRLCDTDQKQILDHIRPIVDHNYNMLMNRDLEAEPFRQITELIKKHADQTI